MPKPQEVFLHVLIKDRAWLSPIGIMGPVIQPLKVNKKDVVKMIMSGCNIYEYLLDSKQTIKLTVHNIMDDDKRHADFLKAINTPQETEFFSLGDDEEEDETVEEEEIKTIEQIIAESRIVDFHTTDITKDKSAIVKGLTNENGKVIEIDDNHIVFIYNFSEQPGSITKGYHEASVFFINPETGNYEQIAKFKSKRGMERLKYAVNKKLDEMDRNSERHEDAQQIQRALLLQSQERK